MDQEENATQILKSIAGIWGVKALKIEDQKIIVYLDPGDEALKKKVEEESKKFKSYELKLADFTELDDYQKKPIQVTG